MPQMPPGAGIPVQRDPNIPPGLEYLSVLNQVLIKQKVEILEAFTGFETNNKYTVLNVMGQPIYQATENTGCCNRNCCGPIRSFEIGLTDNSGQEVIHLSRPLRCQSCCCPCCLQKLEVHGQGGMLLGTVEQDWSLIHPRFTLRDAADNPIMKIKGPFCTWSCRCGDVEFKVETPDGNEVGMISKQWSGLGREAFTDADNFGVSFPQDLDVKAKAVLLGAVFLIDFMFFEKSGNNENDGIGMIS